MFAMVMGLAWVVFAMVMGLMEDCSPHVRTCLVIITVNACRP